MTVQCLKKIAGIPQCLMPESVGYAIGGGLQLCDLCMRSKLGANQIDSVLTTRSNDRIAHAQDK